MQLRSLIAHYHIVQGGQIHCCFCQAAAESLHSHNSGWSTLTPTRWDNSVLCTTHCPTRLVQQWSTTLSLWQVGSSLHSCFLKFVQNFTLPTLTVVNYIHCLYYAVLSGGDGAICPRAALDYVPRRTCGVWHSPVGFADSHRFGSRLAKRNGGQLFPRWTITGTRSRLAGHMPAFRRLGVQNIAELSSIWSPVFYFFAKKVGGDSQRLFPRQKRLRGCAALGFPSCFM
jgi:hypothetical protein